jgi:hypothetical protein
LQESWLQAKAAQGALLSHENDGFCAPAEREHLLIFEPIIQHAIWHTQSPVCWHVIGLRGFALFNSYWELSKKAGNACTHDKAGSISPKARQHVNSNGQRSRQ